MINNSTSYCQVKNSYTKDTLLHILQLLNFIREIMSNYNHLCTIWFLNCTICPLLCTIYFLFFFNKYQNLVQNWRDLHIYCRFLLISMMEYSNLNTPPYIDISWFYHFRWSLKDNYQLFHILLQNTYQNHWKNHIIRSLVLSKANNL